MSYEIVLNARCLKNIKQILFHILFKNSHVRNTFLTSFSLLFPYEISLSQDLLKVAVFSLVDHYISFSEISQAGDVNGIFFDPFTFYLTSTKRSSGRYWEQIRLFYHLYKTSWLASSNLTVDNENLIIFLNATYTKKVFPVHCPSGAIFH